MPSPGSSGGSGAGRVDHRKPAASAAPSAMTRAITPTHTPASDDVASVFAALGVDWSARATAEAGTSGVAVTSTAGDGPASVMPVSSSSVAPGFSGGPTHGFVLLSA